jgi:hypothetical protein
MVVVGVPVSHYSSRIRLGVKRMTPKGRSVNGRDVPKVIGSLNVRDAIKNLFAENVKTSFIKGAQTAQEQIVNGIVLGGHIGVIQGCLTYTYYVVDHASDRAHIVIIDTGSSKVLYASEYKHTKSRGESMFNLFGHGVGLFGVMEGYVPT